MTIKRYISEAKIAIYAMKIEPYEAADPRIAALVLYGLGDIERDEAAVLAGCQPDEFERLLRDEATVAAAEREAVRLAGGPELATFRSGRVLNSVMRELNQRVAQTPEQMTVAELAKVGDLAEKVTGLVQARQAELRAQGAPKEAAPLILTHREPGGLVVRLLGPEDADAYRREARS